MTRATWTRATRRTRARTRQARIAAHTRATPFSFFPFCSHCAVRSFAACVGRLPKPPKPPPKPCTVQTNLIAKVAMAEVATDSSYVTASPALPELTPDNAASRYVFVPASEFKAEGIGGWVARCALPTAHSLPPLPTLPTC